VHRKSGRIYRVVYAGDDKRQPTPARASWLTARSKPGFDVSDIDHLLASESEGQRAMGVRYLCEDLPERKSTTDRLVAIASADASGLVRLEVAAGLQRLPIEQRIDVASALCQRGEDADDRQQPLMIWYGIEEAVASRCDLAIGLAMKTKLPKVRRLIARRLGDSLDERARAVQDLLTAAMATESAALRLDVLQGLSEGLRGRVRADAPSNWESVAAVVESRGAAEEKSLVQELSLVFGDGRARQTVVALAFDDNADPVSRRRALNSLMRQPTADLLPKLLLAINDKVIAGEVVRALAYYEAPGVSMRLINRWKRSVVDRPIVIDSLVARKTYAVDLMKAIAAGTIPADAISPYQARQIDNLGDAELSKRLRKLWGNLRETPEAKKQEMARWKSTLSTDRIGAADVLAGKAVFLKQCAACHQLYGDGRAVGPNLTGSDRHNLDYLLGNILDPSAVVPASYRMSVFQLDDGRVLSGVVTAESENALTLQTQQRTEEVDKRLILDRQVAELSLMPDGIVGQLREGDVANLVAYLMTKAPVASTTEKK
jgi:putative heme-binding domain-containing protein